MLSIIIINYNSAQLIVDCLRSIEKETLEVDYELLIVDNSNDIEGKALILASYENLRWYSMPYNAGFARANNEGIKHAKGDIVLLLNPDTIIIEGGIDKCYRQFKNSAYVACGVQLLNEDLSPQISGNYAMKGGLNYLLPLPFVGPFLKWAGETCKVSKPNVAQTTSLVEVDWVNGAFLMVKKQVIDEAGLLDEDFFLYAEEAEWCSRLKKQGALCIYGDCNVLHLQGETANDAFNSEGKGYYNLYDRKGLQIMVSNFVRIRKQFGAFWFLFDLLVYTFTIVVFFIASILQNIFHLRPPFAHFDKVRMYSKNVFFIWKLSPIILKNKPHFYKVL